MMLGEMCEEDWEGFISLVLCNFGLLTCQAKGDEKNEVETPMSKSGRNKRHYAVHQILLPNCMSTGFDMMTFWSKAYLGFVNWCKVLVCWR
jgi:hypothetical protein